MKLLEKLLARQVAKIQGKVDADFAEHGAPRNAEDMAATLERVTGKKMSPTQVEAILAFVTKGKAR